MSIWVAATDWGGVGGEGDGYCDFFGYGQLEEGQARYISANWEQLCAHLYARDYDAHYSWSGDPDVWTHCAMTVDADGVAIYVNGELLETSDIVPETALGQLSIGGLAYGLSDAIMSGCVRDARIYNRVLTADEIAALAAQDQ